MYNVCLALVFTLHTPIGMAAVAFESIDRHSCAVVRRVFCPISGNYIVTLLVGWPKVSEDSEIEPTQIHAMLDYLTLKAFAKVFHVAHRFGKSFLVLTKCSFRNLLNHVFLHLSIALLFHCFFALFRHHTSFSISVSLRFGVSLTEKYTSILFDD